jgi:hypothetical protein
MSTSSFWGELSGDNVAAGEVAWLAASFVSIDAAIAVEQQA